MDIRIIIYYKKTAMDLLNHRRKILATCLLLSIFHVAIGQNNTSNSTKIGKAIARDTYQ
tara:strand:- start:1121 stop:1297 length:177 start_codon:yes stop_codon:yes gene_type:complete